MSVQMRLSIPEGDISLQRLVKFTPSQSVRRWKTGGINPVGGVDLGIIEILGVRAYGVVLQMDDGKIKTFDPHSLLPEVV